MWRTLLVLVILAALAGFARHYQQAHPQARPVYEGFWELRLKMTAGDRDLEFVAVGDKPLEQDCAGNGAQLELAKFCTPAIHCTRQAFQCEREIAPRYQRMLDAQPAALHYVHYVVATPEGPRKAAIVGWGLTADESQLLCNKLGHDGGFKEDAQNHMRCI